jgi:hypothetical protein
VLVKRTRCIRCGTSQYSDHALPIFGSHDRLRYAFPAEPVDGVIDLTAEERHFYFNSYSGEISLDFPAADTFCVGGILADGML